MSFNSLEFIIFLPVVFFLYWFACKTIRRQNILVIIASYLFYGWWDWRFLILIAITTLCSYASGLLIERYAGRRGRQKLVSGANIVLNIGILATFKYYNFFATGFNDLMHAIGLSLDWPTAHIILPVGISFYTFQALSYSIDVYRGTMRAERDPIAFFAFISFFPQLVAGPIERAANLLPQFVRPRSFDYAKAVDGCRQMLWGFFKKVVIADTCASVVNPIWNNFESYSSLNLALCCVLFSFQVYCDFSGYSDIAIGCARLFGINLMRNFNYPYFSRNIPDFWRRWHISLMSWFRDYVYFPLGGSRCPKWRTIFNNYAVFIISGFWHGADWTFVLYGCFHATMMVPFILFGIKSKYEHNVGYGRLLPSLKEVGQMALTFALVSFARILFRGRNVGEAFSYMGTLFSGSVTDGHGIIGKWALLLCAVLIGVEWVQRDKQHVLQLSQTGLLAHRWFRWTTYLFLLMFTILGQGAQQDFIYFQF